MLECEIKAPSSQIANVKFTITVLFSIVAPIAACLSVWWKLAYPIRTKELAEKISAARIAHGRAVGVPGKLVVTLRASWFSLSLP